MSRILDDVVLEGPPSPSDLAADKIRLFESVARLLDRLSRHRPVLAVFDDLHWLDPASLEVLQHLCRDVASLPVLLVVTFRSDGLDRTPGLRPFLATLTRTVPSERIELDRLSPGEVGELAASFAGRSMPQEVTDWLVARSAGTPLFVEVLVRDLLQRELLAPAGAKRVADALVGDKPPELLRDLLADRLAQLPASASGVLATIAVSGAPLPYPLLAAVCGHGARDLDLALEVLLALDEYLRHHGWRLVTHDDVAGRALVELPGLVCQSLRAATNEPTRGEGLGGLVDELAERVPEGHRTRLQRLVADARRAYATIDDQSGVLGSWTGGLLRRALLACGTRLQRSGFIERSDHVVRLTIDEVAVLSMAKVARVARLSRLGPASGIGRPEPNRPLISDRLQ